MVGSSAEGRIARRGTGEPDSSEPLVQMIVNGWTAQRDSMTAAMLTYFPAARSEFIDVAVKPWRSSVDLESFKAYRNFTDRHSVVRLLPKVKAHTLMARSSDHSAQPMSEAQKVTKGISGEDFRLFDGPNPYILPRSPALRAFIEAFHAFLDQSRAQSPV